MFPIIDPMLGCALRWKKAFSRLWSLPKREPPFSSAINQPEMCTLKRVVEEMEHQSWEHKDDSAFWNHVNKVPWSGVAA